MKRESHLPPVLKHYVNGGWTTSATTGVSVNPSDLDEPVGEYARADARMVDAAVDSASAAWRVWSRASAARRARALDAIGSELHARRAELGCLLAREQGKTLPEAIDEVVHAGQVFQVFAEEAAHQPGEPLGVVAVITPWSFPLAIPAAKIAAALSAGNCVVFKPAEVVSGCAWALADIIDRSGLPAGVFNLVLGSGRVAGARLVANEMVRAVSFSGSVTTGTSVLRASAARLMKVHLDTGGHSALIVLNDANLSTAVDATIQSAYGLNGQRHAAASKLIVERGIRHAFTDALLARLSALRIDHALRKGTDIGPVSNDSQLQRNLNASAMAIKEGATLIHGGRAIERETRGYFMEPALLLGCPEMQIARDDIFGPVAVVLAADDYAHALDLANQTASGLPAPCTGLCTTSLKHARHFRRHSHSNRVTVNRPTTVAIGSGAECRLRSTTLRQSARLC
ncbi:aldehyde dehydrogenase family protein (plasmid) [Caballeronia sp. NK8]|nr:aldehyde dehydrogenase family protein [Caballeronia sp. NK8]